MRLSKFSNGDPTNRVKVALMIESKEIGHIITTAHNIIETRTYPVKKGNGSGKGQIEFKDF